jgi:predicted GIY-YIG superfamily endonuclease
MTIRGRELLRARALAAPMTPGVYLIRDTRGELLYVGKAIDLRRRLLDHARTGGGFASRTRAVHWIECADEREALCREADLIAGLSPPFNAVMADEPSFFISVAEASTPGARRRLRFAMTAEPLADADWNYGAFPHLGKGKISWRAVRTNAGYGALLRLCWVAFADPKVRFRIPGRLAGASAPFDVDTRIEATHLTPLRDLLSGRSDRLFEPLRAAVEHEETPNYMRAPLQRDLTAAAEFYELGPRALRQLRTRYGLPAGPIPRATFTELMRAEAAAG